MIPEAIGPDTGGRWVAGPGGNLDDLTLWLSDLGAHMSFEGAGGPVILLECTWKATVEGGILDCEAKTQ